MQLLYVFILGITVGLLIGLTLVEERARDAAKAAYKSGRKAGLRALNRVRMQETVEHFRDLEEKDATIAWYRDREHGRKITRELMKGGPAC